MADAPTVINPVGMTFGTDGTPYVLEWRPEASPNNFPEANLEFTYKDGTKRKVAVMSKNVKDAVKVLRDNKGKGIYDTVDRSARRRIAIQHSLYDGWLYLSGRGTVRRFKQSKPDGPYDIKEVIAQGFCGFHHHQVSGLTIGNDGWLYITAGGNDNYVEGSDGSRATVLRTRAIFRCRPDGSKMQTYAMGFRNPYRDVAFDTAGNMFHADNDNEDGSKFTGCRLMHVKEGDDFGWRLKGGRAVASQTMYAVRFLANYRGKWRRCSNPAERSGGAADLQRHLLAGKLSGPDLLSRCISQADSRLTKSSRMEWVL